MRTRFVRKMAVVACCATLTVGTAAAQSGGSGQYVGLQQARGDVPPATTLTDVLSNVINTNPQVQSKWEALQAATKETGIARGGYFPSLDIEGGVGRASIEDDGHGSYRTDFARVELSQMIYDGWYTPNEVKRLTHAALSDYYQLRYTVQQVALDTVKAYLGVRRYRELVNLARDNYASHVRVYDQIKSRTQSGTGTEANLEQITGRLALAKSNLMTAGSNLHDVIARYQRLTGQLPPKNLAPIPQLDQNIPGNREDAVKRSIENNPAFHAAIENINSMQAKEARTKSKFLPRLDVKAHAGINNQDNAIATTRNDWGRGEEAVQLILSMNLFNGGSDSARRSKVQHELDQAFYDRDTQCVTLRQNTLIAFNDTRQLNEQLAFLQQHAVSTGKVLQAYRQQFQIGERTLLDVLDSENEYFEARRAFVNDEYDLKLAFARTQAAMGDLMTATGLRRENMPTLSDLGGDELVYKAGALCPAVGNQGYTLDQLTQGLDTGANLPREPQKKPDYVMPGNTLFATDKYRLTASAKQDLDKVVEKIKHDDNLQRVFIGGHADSTGTPAINKPLSENRARSVAQYLISQGVDPDLITTRGYGATRPVESNATAAGRAANRRVEITLEHPGE